MRLFTEVTLFAVFSMFLVGCGSMRPPSMNPYYPGYHSRDANEVNQEYQSWEQEQEHRAEEARIRDSLRTDFFSRDSARGYQSNQYNFYDSDPYNSWNFSWRMGHYPSWHRYPYYRRWSSYSWSSPWYIDPFWADDYLWSDYYWSRYHYPYSYPGYSRFYAGFSFPYSPYSHWYRGSYGYYGGYYGGYYDPYYDYWYYSGGSTWQERDTRQGQRPGNRDRFNRPPVKKKDPQAVSVSRTGIQGNVKPRATKFTPAIIDREDIKLRRPVNRDRYQRPRVDRSAQRSSNDNSGSVNRSSDRSKTPSARSTRSRSGSSRSYTPSSSTRNRTSGSARSSSSGRSSGSSNTKSQRPNNRDRE